MHDHPSDKIPIKERKAPKQRRSQQMVDAILVAATRILERHGPEGLNTNQIATQAGVSIGSLYQYFPNKESILAQVVEKQLAADFQRVVGCLDTWRSDKLEQNVRRLVDELIAVYCSRPQYRRYIAFQISSTKQRNAKAFRQILYAALIACKRDTKSHITLTTVEIIFQALRGIIRAYLAEDSHKLTDSELKGELTRLLLGYLSVAKKSPS